MRLWSKMGLAAAAAFVVAGTATAEAAGPRGGTLVYARHADSLFLDPVLNDANVDIWVLTNLYDTLIIPSNDGKSLTPGPGDVLGRVGRRQDVHPEAARGHQVLRRIADHRRGRGVVAATGDEP